MMVHEGIVASFEAMMFIQCQSSSLQLNVLNVWHKLLVTGLAYASKSQGQNIPDLVFKQHCVGILEVLCPNNLNRRCPKDGSGLRDLVMKVQTSHPYFLGLFAL